MDTKSPYADYVQSLATAAEWQTAYSQLENAGPVALPEIIKGLEHPNWRIRKWCAALLDHQANDSCIEGLIRALNDSLADVRRHAVHSIGCQRCKSSPLDLDIVDLLIDRCLHDSSIRVRRSGTHMLGNQPYDERIVAALTHILEHEQDAKLCSNASWALGQQKVNHSCTKTQ